MYVKKETLTIPGKGSPSLFPQQGLYGERCSVSSTRLQTKITYNNSNQHKQYIEQTICPTLGGSKSADRAPSLRGIS